MEQSLKRAASAVAAKAHKLWPLSSGYSVRTSIDGLWGDCLSMRAGAALALGIALLLCCASGLKAAFTVAAVAPGPEIASPGVSAKPAASTAGASKFLYRGEPSVAGMQVPGKGSAPVAGTGETVPGATAKSARPARRPVAVGALNGEPLPGKIEPFDVGLAVMAPALPRLENELTCLALTIYFEARGEPDLGKAAVAHVVLNRVSDRRFPDTICKVVRQGGYQTRYRCQFTWWCDGLSDRPKEGKDWELTKSVAREVFWGYSQDPTHGALWYHADYVHPSWASVYRQTSRIGRHIFYDEGDPEVDLVNLRQ